MNDVAQALKSWLLTGDAALVTGLLIVIKVMLLFAAASVMLWAMRRASASSRHLVIGLVLAGSLALPLLAVVLPTWQVVSIPVAPQTPDRPQKALTEQGDVKPLSTMGTPDVRRGPMVSNKDNTLGVGAAVPSRRMPVTAVSLVIGIWSVVAGGLLALLLLRTIAIRRTIRRATPITEQGWIALLDETKHRLGLKQPVELRLGRAGQMPLVWGTRQPVILLPDECDTWSVDRRRAVLAHELAHIARRDIPVLLIGRAACAMHWFNPLAWWLDRRLSAERERACDDAALQQGVGAALYAEQLLQVAVTYGDSRKLAPLMAAKSELEGRILAILDTQRNRRSASTMTRTVLAVLLLLTLVPLAAATGRATQPVTGNNNPWQSDTADFERQLEALGYTHAGVDTLIAGLSDASALTRGACAYRLGSLGDARAVQPLIAATRDVDARVREWAIRSLADLDDRRALQPMIDRLEDDNEHAREWAARSLGSLGDKSAVQPLIDSLADDNGQVREWAARSLGDLGDPRAVQPLIDSLADDNGQVREWAARSLGDLGDPRAVQPLIDSLEDDNEQVREWAARSLGDLRDERAIQPLIALLDDENSQVREWASRSLGDLREAPDDGRKWQRRHPEPLMPGLESRGRKREPGDPAAIEGLIRGLKAGKAEEREWAVRSLGKLDDGRSVGQLIELLHDDPNSQVREWAGRALGEIGDRRAILPLIDALRDSNSQVREWATRSLGVLQDERMVLPLIDGLADRNSQVREWSVRALGAYGDPRAIEPITRMLDDKSDAVQRWAKRALESMNHTR